MDAAVGGAARQARMRHRARVAVPQQRRLQQLPATDHRRPVVRDEAVPEGCGDDLRRRASDQGEFRRVQVRVENGRGRRGHRARDGALLAAVFRLDGQAGRPQPAAQQGPLPLPDGQGAARRFHLDRRRGVAGRVALPPRRQCFGVDARGGGRHPGTCSHNGLGRSW
jgi:hypothetical protein